MRLTRRINKVFLIVITVLLSPFLFYKMQGTKIYWLPFDYKKIGEQPDVFVIQNPPSSKEDLIKLIESMNNTINLKTVASKKYYGQSFYKETFNLTRFYKPYYMSFIGTYIDIREDNSEFTQEHLASYIYSDTDLEKKYGDKKGPVYPYYRFYDGEGSISYEYYPKGLKDNPNKHWEKW